MNQSGAEKPTIWLVEVYKKGKKLSPVKEWGGYMYESHDQFRGWCYHYRIPDHMVDAALKQGAQRLKEPFSCMNE